jgi:vWA domain found in the FtsH ternary systems/N-terminal helical region fused to the FtsH ternary system vWA domain
MGNMGNEEKKKKMNSYELRDLDEARDFLLQGLWLQRVVPAGKGNVVEALAWAMEIAAGGQPLPPIGFVADLGHVAFGMDWEGRDSRNALAIPSLPINLFRTYEDHVLGKIYADWTFAKASDSLRRYQGRDRAKGLAFTVNQLRERAQFPGVELPPGVIKHAMESKPEEILNQGWESLRQDGVQPLLLDLYEGLIQAARRTAEALGPEDVFELEHRTALDDFGQRLALRQVVRVATSLEATLPRHRIRPQARRMEVPTRILDEDTYPVGGFSSISTRGSIESLLHSQLAYMEPSGADRPDLFDVKFVRDELLYYSRDENQFLRRRRTFVVALGPDLVSTRFKDSELQYQRGVLLLALLVVVVRKLTEWLTTDALVFQFLFLRPEDPLDKSDPLAAEQALLQTLLREEILTGLVLIARIPPKELESKCSLAARRSLCHCLTIGTKALPFEADETVVMQMQIAGPRPAIAEPCVDLNLLDGEDPMDSWGQALEHILRRWI